MSHSDPTRSDEVHDHDRGLAHDLPLLVGRRRALGLLGGAGVTTLLVACGGSDVATGTTVSTSTTTSPASSTTVTAAADSTSAAADSGSCDVIPEETAGPYPGDGSNGPNVLTESGVVRSDITSSFGSLSGSAPGAPLTIRFTVLDTASGCSPYEGAAVYVWHADRDGGYSLYSRGVTDQNFLRGVQEAGADGTVRFDSIYPGCYDGRWPHIHFEVYPSLDAATSVGNKLATSQIALPEDTCNQIYGSTSGYEQSVSNLGRVSLDTDMVFRDGYSRELGVVSGSAGDGLTVSLTVPV